MRILELCTNFLGGGIQRHAMELSESLRHQGHSVFLGGTPGPWLNEHIDSSFLTLNIAAVSTNERNVISRIASAIQLAAILRRFLKKERIELIHAHESAPAIVARLATIGLGIPVLVTYHGSEPERVKSFGRIGRATSKLIITPSQRCAEELHDQAGVPKDRLRVIRLGVQPPPVIDPQRTEELRERLLGPDGEILVVIVARLAYQKGMDILVDVVSEVAKQRRDIRFIVVGDGPQRHDVKHWAIGAGVDDLLKFEGETDEPYLYLKAADLFLLTSRWEALPITIAEAFQAALPVIATDTGGVSELVSESVGRVIPVGHVGKLAAAILEVCGNEKLRKTMSAAALSVSREDRFSIPHIHRIFEQTYAEIIGVPLRDKAGP